MDWINDLIWGHGIGHSVLLLGVIISLGLLLGKIKIFGVSLGATFILFVGIILGHFGMGMDDNLVHFLRDFGLILFIFAIGMKVGPGFFSSFKEGGVTLNGLAVGVVLLGAITALVIHWITDIPVATMVGIMSGAVTNTPGLGAAQQALKDMGGETSVIDTMAMGYAVAYPLGVIGIILTMIVVKSVFKIDFKKEEAEFDELAKEDHNSATAISLQVENPAICGKTIREVKTLFPDRDFVISRHWSVETNEITLANPDTVLKPNDKIFVILKASDTDTITAQIGKQISMERQQWVRPGSTFVNRRIVVTKPEVNGKRLGSLALRKIYGCNITRVQRAGVDLLASRELILQLGDTVSVVGTEASIAGVESKLGNSMRRLYHPNLATIFIGIAVGVIFGSIPFTIPGVPQPFKLGLAGGPLIIAILLAKFGPRFGFATYTTQSANLMLSEIGISLFLACVGIKAGDGFVDTVANGGYSWIGYGFIITFLPLLIMGIVGRKFFKVNYFTLTGIIAGSHTDPPALAYANSLTAKDAPAVGYATVYPLTMFFRVLIAELMVLLFV
ncbi:MAG: putative transporter [Bacteroidales bacterium]|nr:putative transporter [Bacteroidales bacterium]